MPDFTAVTDISNCSGAVVSAVSISGIASGEGDFCRIRINSKFKIRIAQGCFVEQDRNKFISGFSDVNNLGPIR